MKGILVLLIGVVALFGAIVSAHSAETLTSAEDFSLALDSLAERASLIEAALTASTEADADADADADAEGKPKKGGKKKGKVAFEMGEKELDRLGKGMEALKVDIRQLFTMTRLRAIEVGLKNFEKGLLASYKFQKLEKFFPKVVKEAHAYYTTVPNKIEWISKTWYPSESKDPETDKMIQYEKDFYALNHAYSWLKRRSVRPFYNLEALLTKLKTSRSAMKEWFATPAKSTLAVMSFVEGASEVEVETEADAEAAAEAEAHAEAEAEEEGDADADQEGEADADQETEGEADADQEQEQESEADAEQEAETETETQSLLERASAGAGTMAASRAQAGADAIAAAEMAALFESESGEADATLAALVDTVLEENSA